MTGHTRAPDAYDVVVPTVGRPSLRHLLLALDAAEGPPPRNVVVVDDRRHPEPPLVLPRLETIAPVVVNSGGRGPAAARNAGWRRCRSPWVVFLDDDVVPSATWRHDLTADLCAAADCDAGEDVAATTARIVVPMPAHRRPTDAERGVGALERAVWITADMSVRRTVLERLDGFDERFRRAYREDTDLALRITDTGARITRGRRTTVHPVRSGTWSSSISAQRGNADDALMRRLHGPDWRRRGHAPAGALRDHVITTSTAGLAALALAIGRPRAAAAASVVALVRLARFWGSRVRQGPVDVREWARLAVSSAAIPFAATGWAAWGMWRARRLAPSGVADRRWAQPPSLVLFDRDGTLVEDVPYNGDPELVTPMPGAREAVERLRTHGIGVGIITNQSGIGRGLISRRASDAVTRRVDELLGPFDTVQVCPHTPDAGCRCRKPSPGMVLAAAAEMDLIPRHCAVIGDIGADVAAALAAGARPVLVPTRHTRTEEIDAAPLVAPDLATAVDILLQPVRTAADPHSDGHPVGSSGPVTDPAGTAA